MIVWHNYSFMQDVASLLRSFMKANGLTQEQLALAAGVSQSTVCRALAGGQLRQGSAKSRLFKYASIDDDLDGSRKVQQAFRSIWDGSDEHAAAVARIIESLEGLQPRKAG